MAKSTVHVFTKLKDEPFFIECAHNLVDRSGVQLATITSIDAVRLERKVTSDPETWAIGTFSFSSLQVLAQGSHAAAMIAGVVDADPDADPAPGDYRFIVECTIQFTAAFGSGVTGKVFRRDAHIPATALTAPAA